MNKRVVTLHGDQFSVVGNPLKVGDKAPNFKLIDNGLEVKTLQDFKEDIKLLALFLL